MEKNRNISLGKVIFIIISIIVIGGGVLLLNYRNNESNQNSNSNQTQKDSDNKNNKKKNDGKVYESFSYTRKDICNDLDDCEKTFTYGEKEYKLVIKKNVDSGDTDEMDSMSFNSVTINGIDVAEGAMDYLEKINFTKDGYIVLELSDSLSKSEYSLIFYDIDLEIVTAYNSIRPFNYDGSNSGKFYSCEISGADDILKEFEFKYTDDGEFSDKKISEKKGDDNMSLSLFFDRFINETININQAISIFFGNAKPYLISEKEMPNIRFIFPVHYYELFKNIVEETSIIKDRTMYTPTKENVEEVFKERNAKNSIPTIYVDDPDVFFKTIVEITEALQILRIKNNLEDDILTLSEAMQRYIWLRMGSKDFADVNTFLKHQRDFLRDETFDAYIKPQQIASYYDYTITAQETCGHSYDETYKRMIFTFYKDDEKIHHLPIVDFGIREEDGKKICYIYAVQNIGYLKDKTVERKLYKLNKDIENPENHPNFVMAMKLFIDLANREGISEIRVPDGQVLSHRFHEIMSNNAKKSFEEKFGNNKLENFKNANGEIPEHIMFNYMVNKGYYERLVGKADFIEDAKTTKLIALLKRMSIQFSDYELIPRDENVDYTSLKVKTKTYKK